MKKVALSGYYGMLNYGDDLFAIVAFLSASKYWPNYNARILSAPLNNFDAKYGVPGFLPAQIFRYHNLLGALARTSALVLNLPFVDKFVFAGGSIFHSERISVRNIGYALIRRTDCFSAIGVSVGPFRNSKSEQKVKEQLRRFQYISSRDHVSFERLKSYKLDAKLVESTDLVGSLPSILPPRQQIAVSDEGLLKVGFSPCYLQDKPELAKTYCDLFVESCVILSQNAPVSINVLCLNQHYKVGDIDLCLYTLGQLRRQGVHSSVTFYQDIGALNTWSLISLFDAYFSGRLHGAITAYLCDVPFFLFEYHEKCSAFLESIGKSQSERAPGQFLSAEYFRRAFQTIIFNRKGPGLTPQAFCKLSERNFSESPLCNL